MSASSNSSLKYLQLVERFRGDMQAGVLRPGDRLPSLNEMREEEGLSRPTVEKAYALLEREGLIEKLHGAGVFVREPQRKSTQGVIGLSGLGFSWGAYSPYWSHLLGGAREAASRAGMQLLLLDARSSLGWEKADGVLLCDWDDHRRARKMLPGQPVVSLLAPIDGMASVVADDHAGAYAATEYLIGLGHRRIGFLHGYDYDVVAGNRLSGYRNALKAAGIRPNGKWMRRLRGRYDLGAKFTSEARKNMLLWLRDDWSTLAPTALLCHNDEAALGVMGALNEKGIRVPDDVSIVGFDGTEFCDLTAPTLTSIEVPLREIGAAGVEMLLKQIEADKVSDEHQVLPVRLQLRQSAIALSAEDEKIKDGKIKGGTYA